MTSEEQAAEFGKMACEKRSLLDEEKALTNQLRNMADTSKAVSEVVEGVVGRSAMLTEPALRVVGDSVEIRSWGSYKKLFHPQEFADTLRRMLEVRQRIVELTETLGF